MNNLKSLSLRGNGIKDVPLMIYKLNKLESISLRNNPIENLPIEMFRMNDHLKVINLEDTNISMSNRKIILDSFPNQRVIFDLIQWLIEKYYLKTSHSRIKSKKEGVAIGRLPSNPLAVMD